MTDTERAELKRLADTMRRIEARSIPEPNTGCWLWMGAIDKDGYGRFSVTKVAIRAHRASWLVHCGPIDVGLFVCHRCDVRACVNPAHLFLGTHQDNIADMMRKGRRNSPRGDKSGARKHPSSMFRGHGEATSSAKLRDVDIPIILGLLSQGRTNTAIARLYGVTNSAISKIKTGQQWTHIPRSS